MERQQKYGAGAGGWMPVLRRHGRNGKGFSAPKVGMYTLFVDDIPDSMDPKGLYDCPVAAQMAVQKANGLWCDNKALKVKPADFEKEHGAKPRLP
ncbi:hypothetical protein CsSME_00034949 [Camellia sinensis var. sinensis]